MRRLPIVLTLMALLPLHTKAAPGTDPFEQNRRLGRGINIPGVFDRDGKTVPDPPMKPEYFKKIGDAGFKNVRLVIRWSSYAQQEAPYSIDPVFFKRVDWAVEQSLANKLAVVLDFHYYPLISFTGTQTSHADPQENRTRFLALWRQVAEHYRQAPPEVMFGVLNEPSRPNLGIDGWNALVAKTIPLLRSTNPDRTLLVQTANGGGFGSLESLRIPESEHNTIVEVHNYDPGRFTHQQASWSSNRIYKDVHWTGTPEEKAAIDEAFAKAAAWAKKNNRPSTSASSERIRRPTCHPVFNGPPIWPARLKSTA